MHQADAPDLPDRLAFQEKEVDSKTFERCPEGEGGSMRLLRAILCRTHLTMAYWHERRAGLLLDAIRAAARRLNETEHTPIGGPSASRWRAFWTQSGVPFSAADPISFENHTLL
jgi:hypothetical protein